MPKRREPGRIPKSLEKKFWIWSRRAVVRENSLKRAPESLPIRYWEKRTYQFVEMKKNPAEEAGEEEPFPITINGKACRTPDEDIKWDEEQAILEANAPAKGKGPAKGKKK